MAEHKRYLLAADVDNTLVPMRSVAEAERVRGYAALGELCAAIAASPQIVAFGSATGRTIISHDAYAAGVPAFGVAVSAMNFKITSVGTALHRRAGSEFVQDAGWPSASDWRPHAIRQALQGWPELSLQEPSAQNDYKISYNVRGVPDSSHDEYVAEIAARLAGQGVTAQIIFSGGHFLDCLPKGVDKGAALRYAASVFAVDGEEPFTISAGDSMNDAPLLAAADLAILPGNADESLRRWAQEKIPSSLYIAREKFAAGVHEGLRQEVFR